MVTNRALGKAYIEDMAQIGEKVLMTPTEPFIASTDMGNVSQEVPSIHASFAIPTESPVALHSREFAAAAKTTGGHEAAIKSAKGMATLAIRVLVDDDFASSIQKEFDETFKK